MYTWNKNWICSYESPWGIINKFLYANEVHCFTARKELTTNKASVMGVCRYNHTHTGIISNYNFTDNSWLTGKDSIGEYGTYILENLLKPLLTWQNFYYNTNSICFLLIRKNLYYCPECMKYGQHLMFQQFTFYKKCRIHNLDLCHTCPVCGKDIPYVIEFRKNIRYYGCKHCGNQLFNNDNFGEVLNFWQKNKNDIYNIKTYRLDEIPIIISNHYDQSLSDYEINEYLLSIYTNVKNTIKAKYIICKGMIWADMNFGDIITPNISEKRKIEEYVFLYAYQTLYRHISRSKHIRHKLGNAENYVRNICPFQQLLSKQQIDYGFKKFDLDAVTMFLWKRDMEYSGGYLNGYYMNKTAGYYYKFNPDDEIINYIKFINDILPNEIDNSYKFSILVHIAITLMKDKYQRWENLMKYLYKNNDKYELTKKLENITLRSYSSEYNKEFLLTIDRKEQIYKLYFSSK